MNLVPLSGRVIFSDWHGVLSSDPFWTSIRNSATHPLHQQLKAGMAGVFDPAASARAIPVQAPPSPRASAGRRALVAGSSRTPALDQFVARAVAIVDEHHPTIRSQRRGDGRPVVTKRFALHNNVPPGNRANVAGYGTSLTC
jgi:hypothetical protein